MSTDEFQIIQRFFNQQVYQHHDVVLGIGDDAAILQVQAGQQLLVSMDTLVEGVHFRASDTAMDIGYKSLAVNLSDMAAMGAMPAWITLSLTLPEFNEAWLKGFCIGFFSLAQEHRVQLVGGDTTRGPLSISVQIHGLIPAGRALLRSGAQEGDHILVTGTLGDAACALDLPEAVLAQSPQLEAALHRPVPRVQQGVALRGLASSAIDVSDGLLADLGHVMTASGLAAHVDCAKLPLSVAVLERVDQAQAWHYALSGGDDYELCLTVPDDRLQEVLAMSSQSLPFTPIGRVQAGQGVYCYDADGEQLELDRSGYRHF